MLSGLMRAKRDRGQIQPAIQAVLADERQVPHLDTTAAIKFCPARSGHTISMLRLVLCAHSYDGEVRHVRPFFVAGQPVGVEQVMQFPHAVGGVSNTNEDRRRNRDKSLDFTE